MNLSRLENPGYKIAAIYLVVASSWIVLSDKLLSVWVGESENFIPYSIIKGLIFILITTLMIFYMVRNYTREYAIKSSRLEKSLEEKKLLLSELHHRVKNNLAIITALLELEMQSYSDVRIKEGLQYIHSRIFAISKIQELLYEHSDFTSIPFDEYLQNEVESLFQNLDQTKKVDRLNINLLPVRLNVNQAIPLALLLNEIFQQINETKENVSILSVSLSPSGENVLVQISFDSDIEIEEFLSNTKKYFTAELIQVFIEQIGLEFNITRKNQYKTLHLNLHNGIKTKGPYSNISGDVA